MRIALLEIFKDSRNRAKASRTRWRVRTFLGMVRVYRYVMRERAFADARTAMYDSLEVNDRRRARAAAAAAYRLATTDADRERFARWRSALRGRGRVGVKSFPIVALRVADDPSLGTIVEIEEALSRVAQSRVERKDENDE